MDGFGGEVIHSSEYRNGDRWAGRTVLVVGLLDETGWATDLWPWPVSRLSYIFLASILAAHTIGERRSAGDGHSLQQGTSAWEGFGR